MDEAGIRARIRADKQDRYDRAHHTGGVKEPKPLPEDGFDQSNLQNQHHQLNVPGQPPSLQSSLGLDSLSLNNSSSSSSSSSSSTALKKPQALNDQSRQSSQFTTTKRSLHPHLQFMCGPMLRYDNVDLRKNIWLGFCCVVTADTGSVYEPTPMLQMRWNFYSQTVNQNNNNLTANNENPNELRHEVTAERIYVYDGPSDSYSFWRFRLEIPMGDREIRINYSINRGAEISFYVPAINQAFRWVGHSCNGFSAGVDRESFKGPDPVWNDLLEKHKVHPFHLLVGGGDQLYCDPIAKEPELMDWLSEKDQDKKKSAVMTQPMKLALDRFFFSHYCNWFRSGSFGKAISCIPMINMLDDHDIIDGFGSYPPDLQMSPVFSSIGSRGYFWYLLFQLFIVDTNDGISNESLSSLSIAKADENVNGKVDRYDEGFTRSRVHSSLILGERGPYIPFRNHSFLCYLGPKVYILLLDCRSERMKDRVCSPETYEIVFEACKSLPSEVKHLIVLVGIPIVYPRMVFAEKILEKKDNIVFKMTKKFGFLPGLYNNFNADPELLDDMNDHWCAQSHKQERNWLITQFQNLGSLKKLRITFLSGDVHCAAVGRLFSVDKTLKPEFDPKYMLNIVSSAIVNTPPPVALIGLMGQLSKVNHKALLKVETNEDMVDVFKFDTNGNKLNNPRFMARRNYCAVRLIEDTNELEFNLRVEIQQGDGITKGYPVIVPAPNF